MLHNASFRITGIATFLNKHKNTSPEKLQLRLFSTQKLYDCTVLIGDELYNYNITFIIIGENNTLNVRRHLFNEFLFA